MSDGVSSVTRVDPETHEPLVERDGALVRPSDGHRVAPIIDGIPRFVDVEENYAESFGWQWKKWEDIYSAAHGSQFQQRDMLLGRTCFESYAMEGKTLLECGMGGGDDTEVLLDLPFAEIHSFDISTSVERAARLACDRLTISQASIFDIPYADASFDFVFTHRVLQHTPDPEKALRCCCAKVKPGGVLFAHAYKRSLHHMMGWRYKYRWFSKRLPWTWVYQFVERFGPFMYRLNEVLYRWLPSRVLAYNFIPFHWIADLPETRPMSRDQKIELAKVITFDALTPRYDQPMTSRKFRSIIESEGFEIEHIHDPASSPIYCTAVRRSAAPAS